MRVMTIGTKLGDVKVRIIDGSLESLQKCVDGLIECAAPIELRHMGIQLLVNEEGVLRGLDYNENTYPFFFVGNAVAVGVKNGDFVSLSLPQIKYLWKWLRLLEG